MNKSTLQEIAGRLESTVRSSNPNQRYTELMKIVGELNNAINQPEVVEEKPTKKKKSSKKKKTSTED
tara:strand:+ start:94 stop:294 length:201 start_codon:yes stop_codon:yes gene_type:complete